MKLFFSAAQQKSPEYGPEERALLQDLQETKRQLDVARQNFEIVSDPELVSSSVYQINSLQSRYSYLLQRAKALEVMCLPAVPLR